jgi:hypothetical protein
MRTTNYTLRRVINIYHSLNTEQIKVQISRKSTLCSVQIICTVIRVSGKCASCKVSFISNENFHTRIGHENPRGGEDVQLYSFFNLGARWGGWVVKTTPRPLYLRERPGTFIKNVCMESKSRIRRALSPYNPHTTTWLCLDIESVRFLLFYCDQL